MLLALPIITAVVVSYIQFAFIQHGGYLWFRPLMWDALEDLKGIMRRRMPLWMRPISAGILKLTLPAPIPTNDLSVATSSNQTLMAVPPTEVPISVQKTYFFHALCGAAAFICLAGSYTIWTSLVTPALKSPPRSYQRKHRGKPKPTHTVHPMAYPSAPMARSSNSISDLISPNLHRSAPNVTRIPGPLNPILPMAPTVLESRLDTPLLGSTPATVNESTWKELRVPFSTESPDVIDIGLRRNVVVIAGVPYNPVQSRMTQRKYNRRNTFGYGLHSAGSDCAEETDTRVIYSTPDRLPAIREELPDARAPSVDLPTCTERPVEGPSEAGPLQDVPVASESIIGEPEATPDDLVVGNLDTGISTVRVSSGDSIPLGVLEATELSESPIGRTPDLLQVQVDLRDHQEKLVSGSTASTTWFGFVTPRDSLVYRCSSPATRTVMSGESDETVHLMQDVGDYSLADPFDHDNAWANDDVDSLAPSSINGTSMIPDASNRDKASAYDYPGCIERLCTCSDSSTSIGWMSQCSISTQSDTPLITPSNSLPQVPRVDEPSCPKDPLDVPGSSMDFIFESQLSQNASPPPIQSGSPLVDTDMLDSFVGVEPVGFSPTSSDAVPTPNLSPESQMLQRFLDDRTYAEVAGIPSAIESARATLSLSRWRIPRPGSQRPQPNGPSPTRSGCSASYMPPGSWEGHGIANSM